MSHIPPKPKYVNQEAYDKWKAGEITEVQYQNELAKAKGHANRNDESRAMYQKRGFKTRREYREYLAKQKGFPNLKAQLDASSQRRGFKDDHDLKRHLTRLKNIKRGNPADMFENKSCTLWIGYVIGETILSKVFKNVQRMSTNHPGYDFICNHDKKIDVKTSCLHENGSWLFDIDKNKEAEYFLLLAFDNRTDMNPMYIWLIKGDEIIKDRPLNDRMGLGISNNRRFTYKFDKYLLNDKLEEIKNKCESIKDKS